MTFNEEAHLRGLLKKATADKEAQDLLLRDTREELARVRKSLETVVERIATKDARINFLELSLDASNKLENAAEVLAKKIDKASAERCIELDKENKALKAQASQAGSGVLAGKIKELEATLDSLRVRELQNAARLRDANKAVEVKTESAQSYREKLMRVSEENDTLRERGLNLAAALVAKLNEPGLLEKLADIEHERWSSWEKYREQRLEELYASPVDKRVYDDADDVVKHQETSWKELRETPYAELSEHSKESDRKEARKTLAAITAYLGSGGI